MAGTVIAIISVSLTGVSVIAVLLGFVLKGNTRQVHLEDRMQRMEEDYKEFEKSTKEKFADYYAFKSDTEKKLEKIDNNVEHIMKTMEEIKQDLKEKK